MAFQQPSSPSHTLDRAGIKRTHDDVDSLLENLHTCKQVFFEDFKRALFAAWRLPGLVAKPHGPDSDSQRSAVVLSPMLGQYVLIHAAVCRLALPSLQTPAEALHDGCELHCIS